MERGILTTSVTVTPALLKWSRERALMTPQDLAQQMKVSEGKVIEWERTGSLTLSRLEKWAKRTRTPIGYLFLNEPPDEALPIADFRTLVGTEERQASPDLLEAVHICQRRQAWFREFALYDQAEPLQFVGTWGTTRSHSDLAKRIRGSLSWDKKAREDLPSWEAALRELAERIEGLGVLVMRSGIVGSNTRRKLDVDEFRGFALADDLAPLIFVNSADARSAQMFTLIHELAHIWLGESGISDVAIRSQNQSERFCNQVAAEVLVPLEEFLQRWRKSDDQYEEARQVAREFRVSTHVVLIRALGAQKVAYEQFQDLYRRAQEQSYRASSDGGDFYRTQGVRLGKRFTAAVVHSALEGRTTYTEAYRLLGVRKGSTFDRLARSVGVIE